MTVTSKNNVQRPLCLGNLSDQQSLLQLVKPALDWGSWSVFEPWVHQKNRAQVGLGMLSCIPKLFAIKKATPLAPISPCIYSVDRAQLLLEWGVNWGLRAEGVNGLSTW